MLIKYDNYAKFISYVVLLAAGMTVAANELVPAGKRYLPPFGTLILEEYYGYNHNGKGTWVDPGSVITVNPDSITININSTIPTTYLPIPYVSHRLVEKVIDIGIESWETANWPGNRSATFRVVDGYSSGYAFQYGVSPDPALGSQNVNGGILWGFNGNGVSLKLPERTVGVIRLSGKATQEKAYYDDGFSFATTTGSWNAGGGIDMLQMYSMNNGSSSWKISWIKIYVNVDPATYGPPLGPAKCGDAGTVYLPGDISGPQGFPDCYVNLYDLSAVGAAWLSCYDSANPDCINYVQSFEGLPIEGGGAIQSIAGAPDDANLVLAATDVSGIARSTDGGQSWSMSNGNLKSIWHYSIADVAFAPSNPDYVFAAAGKTWGTTGYYGHFLVSTDRGLSWQAKPEAISFGGQYGLRQWGKIILVDPSDPAHILVGTGRQGILRTTDMGNSWTDRSASIPMGAIVALISIDGGMTNLLAASIINSESTVTLTGNRGIWKTTDGGLNWTHVYSSDDIFDLAVSGSGEIIAAGNDRVLISSNSGSSWTPLENGLPVDGAVVYAWRAVVADPSANGRFLIIAYTNPFFHHPKLFVRTPGSSAWQAVDSNLSAMYTPFSSQGWYSWSDRFGGAPTAMMFHPGTNRVYMTDWYTVNVSNNAGVTWAARNQGLRTNVPYYAAWDQYQQGRVYLGCVDIGLHEANVSVPGSFTGLSLGNSVVGANASVVQVQYAGNSITVSATNQAIFRKINNGGWTQVFNAYQSCYAGGTVLNDIFARITAGSNGQIMVRLPNGMFVRSQDAGATWNCYSDSVMSISQQAAGNVSPLVFKSGPGKWYVTVSGVNYSASTLGSWTPTDTMGHEYCSTNPSVIFRVSENQLARKVIQRSLDGGVSWQEVMTFQPSEAAVIVTTTSPLVVYAYSSSDLGGSVLYYSSDGGDSWIVRSDVPGSKVTGIVPDPANPKRFLVLSHGLGFWYYEID